MADKKTEVPAAPVPDRALNTADIKEVMKQAFAEGMALGAAQAKLQVLPQVPQISAPAAGIQCGECGQYVSACKSKHTKMSVFPKNRRLGKKGQGFCGVQVNGITYRSNGPGHKVTVPLDNHIEATLDAWERNEEERDQDTGVTRHSANLSPRRGNTKFFTGY